MRRRENTCRRPKQPEDQGAEVFESLVLHPDLKDLLELFPDPAKVGARGALEAGADFGGGAGGHVGGGGTGLRECQRDIILDI